MIYPELSLKDSTYVFSLQSNAEGETPVHELCILDTTFLDGQKEGASSCLRQLSMADLIALHDWLTENLKTVRALEQVNQCKLP